MTAFFKEMSSNLGTEPVQSPSVKTGLGKELDINVELKFSLVLWCVWRRTPKASLGGVMVRAAGYGRAAAEV